MFSVIILVWLLNPGLPLLYNNSLEDVINIGFTGYRIIELGLVATGHQNTERNSKSLCIKNSISVYQICCFKYDL
ncbi:hypothetical protein GCM10022392_11950 [Mucilaginibacter panaciglaebae]|uniref:Uncharacterized protein n=1 Tax=Mucilaginibacter panaciglaebae TaxID=502331 RepID=A0ABP7WLW7_9SPHI